MGKPVGWSPWISLEGNVPWHPVGMRETLLGGQAFRWSEVRPDEYLGLWEDHVVELRAEPETWRVQYRHPVKLPMEEKDLAVYLGMTLPWETMRDQLPWRSDPLLWEAMEAFPGLCLLAQPPGETLLSFLCSSNKQIVQIRQIQEALAMSLGDRLVPEAPWFRLPTWEQLAAVSVETLQSCRMGYRARHVAGCAAFLQAHPGYLESLHDLSTAEAMQSLQVLPGVGPKIAECLLLFGYQRMDAFPIDTWILKVMEQRYGLSGWTRRQVEHFARLHFGPYAGLAQQYLFARVRAEGAS